MRIFLLDAMRERERERERCDLVGDWENTTFAFGRGIKG